MTIRPIIALAFTTVLAAGGVAYAASSSTSSTNTTSSTATTHNATGAVAAATPALPKALVGTPKSFRLTSNRHLVVQDSTGGWYKVDLASDCKPLTDAKSIRIAKSKKAGRVGSVVVGKSYCRIDTFSQTTAPTAAATPAAPKTNTASN
jgi:hypothetical protein